MTKGETLLNTILVALATEIASPVIHNVHRLNRKPLLLGVMLLFFAVPALMALGTLKGKIVDKDTKEGLPGATVIIKGTSIGTAANLDGVYAIANAPSSEQTVVVSYIGYVSTTAVVNIPDDIGIVAFGHSEFAELLSPSLTIVDCPPIVLGQKGMELLVSEIAHTTNRGQHHLILDTTLRVNDSILLGEK